jgi:AcrR family transcriptional regulator
MPDEKRPYRKQRRAELEDETRRRITESAVELHGTLGPARTSMSVVARHAGVQRSTLYRHFPDEEALFRACSSHWSATNPPPPLDAWAAIEDPDERLRPALGELYADYRRTQQMRSNLLRDEATHATTRRLMRDYHGYFDAAQEILMQGRRCGRSRARVEAAIGHALAFSTWRSLTGDQGLDDDDAAELMCRLAAVAGRPTAEARR